MMKNVIRTGIILVVISALVLAGCSTVPGGSAATSVPPAAEQTAEEPSEEKSADTAKEPSEEPTEEPTGEPAGSEDEAVDTEALDKAIEAYVKTIEEEDAKWEFPPISFTLVHLDDDDMPELAIANGDAHPNGVTFYAFDGTGVNELCAAGSLGLVYYEKGKGTVYGWYTGFGETYNEIDIIKDGKLAETVAPVISTVYDENGEETGYKYSLEYEDTEPKDISKEEYEEILAPYLPDNRDYREIEYGKLRVARETPDIAQALKDSLAEEDDLPKPDMDRYHEWTIGPDSVIQ